MTAAMKKRMKMSLLLGKFFYQIGNSLCPEWAWTLVGLKLWMGKQRWKCRHQLIQNLAVRKGHTIIQDATVHAIATVRVIQNFCALLCTYVCFLHYMVSLSNTNLLTRLHQSSVQCGYDHSLWSYSIMGNMNSTSHKYWTTPLSQGFDSNGKKAWCSWEEREPFFSQKHQPRHDITTSLNLHSFGIPSVCLGACLKAISFSDFPHPGVLFCNNINYVS